MKQFYLDDVRPAPEGWILARSVDDLMRLVRQDSMGDYAVSLDFDMGMTSDICPTCNNRGFGRMYDFDHPDYCEDCTHTILTNDLQAKSGIQFLYEITELASNLSVKNAPHIWLPRFIYLHTANPVGRSAMKWVIRDMQKRFDREWPEAFR